MKFFFLATICLAALMDIGCSSDNDVPKADQQSKLPPANTLAGKAARRYRDKRAGPPIGADAGAQPAK
ncbi:MAG: hypothetical protein P4L46_24715 [Fimbriimonas sp.]|nr:hypothetical protein [Fimbriimonas sp.]